MRNQSILGRGVGLATFGFGVVSACTFPEQIVVAGDSSIAQNDVTVMDRPDPAGDRPDPVATDVPSMDDRPNADVPSMDDRPNVDVPTCDANLQSDLNNCGACDRRCAVPPVANNQIVTCAMGSCAVVCRAGFGDCDAMAANGCETDLSSDAANCGMCGQACMVNPTCQRSVCTPFPSDGNEGVFAPMADVEIAQGLHQYTTITIPAGVTVTVGGTGEAELRATGNIEINGTIDVSGGNGSSGLLIVGCDGRGGGGGGFSGRSMTAANSQVAAGGGRGSPGSNGMNAPGIGGAGVPLGGTNGGGGGAGPTYRGGAGGGGSAGGGGGGCATSTISVCVGGAGGSANGGFGGLGGSGMNSQCDGGRGGAAPGGYAGGNGASAMAPNLPGCSGGGGSIGARAAADLSLANSFFGGSGGGGGGLGNPGGCGGYGAGGGGGGGGAIRLATVGSIVIRGNVFANGGAGGNGNGGYPVGGGGGGSGGVIDLRAPTINISGQVSAAGGQAGTSGNGMNPGGNGGLGRVRISANQATCNLSGTFTPQLASGCMASAVTERVYVSSYGR